ncbi:MAG: protein-glutamate O-methyltransferase CheR [Aetokthonos hydrillicola CCALA 1050]|nr:protein-glutamate O-methyltransferase CheR [Aetokthonos hydrillicola CCALA 1050]
MQPIQSFLANPAPKTDEPNREFEILLDFLKQNRGWDLTSYKRSSLMRRFQHRMQAINIDSYQSYLKYLKCHLEEDLALKNDVLINVTGFFRDRDAWDYLAAHVIPKILASKQPHESIRVWSVGCAGGQEVYSLLILLAEALGIDTCVKQVICYATDISESALVQARQATYSDLEITGIPPDCLEKYFHQTQKGYVFHPELRRNIIFCRHDLTVNAPISKIDLLVCRNVLIYLNPEIQASILVRFHFALKKTGYLFLGQAETFINRREIFKPINIRQKIYAKGLKLDLDDYLSIIPKSLRKQITSSQPRS